MMDSCAKYCDALEALKSSDPNFAELYLVGSLELDPHFKTHELLSDLVFNRGDIAAAAQPFPRRIDKTPLAQ